MEKETPAQKISRWDYFKENSLQVHSVLSTSNLVDYSQNYKGNSNRQTHNHTISSHREVAYSPQRYKIEVNHCKNCGKAGHVFHKCKAPITSIGIVAFSIKSVENILKSQSVVSERNPLVIERTSLSPTDIRYLMICRKDSLGYVDFIRGKYSVRDRDYIMNMIKQMSSEEKRRILENDFDILWTMLWGETAGLNQYKSERQTSRDNFVLLKRGIYCDSSSSSENTNPVFQYNLETLIAESRTNMEWKEPEWGFPKGRRNHLENEYTCALREFQEETGFESNLLMNVQNIMPIEEVFTGSNMKIYKHKYYVMMMNYDDTLDMSQFQRSEVSKMEWKTYEECLLAIRPYNLEKRKLIENIHSALVNYHLIVPVG
jgi:8-oxo-dGTP pyrophosphatase MutT (NUDIX family)